MKPRRGERIDTAMVAAGPCAGCADVGRDMHGRFICLARRGCGAWKPRGIQSRKNA